jgi:hypothetical protein
MPYSMSDARQTEAEDAPYAEVDELESARAPRHAPPRPARRRGHPRTDAREDR